MKERPILFQPAMAQAVNEGRKTQTRRLVKPQPVTGPGGSEIISHACPYGTVGDRLWVRESVCKTDDGWIYRGAQVKMYGGRLDADSERCRKELGYKWTPSIHMPRAACRTVLELTDIRVQRVQDISDEDCKAEGITQSTVAPYWWGPTGGKSPRHGFSLLWESINGPGSWDALPWVWALTFKKVEVSK